MPIEQRVVSGARPTAAPKPKITPRERPAAPAAEPEPAKKKNLVPLIMGILVGVIVVGALAFWFFVRPMLADSDAVKEPVAGEVTTVESMNINLSDGHYLRLGFAIQLSQDAEEVASARILDTAIALFSGQKFEDVLEPVTRDALKAQLAAQLDELYEGQVMDVWLTDYVAQ